MLKTSFVARLVAKPGKEEELASFLRGALPLAEQERGTVVWFALRASPSELYIFDAFPDEASREAHLQGPIAAALMAKAPDLLAEPPSILPCEVLASKVPA